MKSKDKAYYEYQLAVSSNLIRNAALITGLFNLLLIIPDIINLAAPEKYIMAAERSLFTLSAAVLFVYYKRIKTFRALSFIISIYELAAAVIFIHVFCMYRTPDFFIQAFGVFIIIIVIFFVPNYFVNMLVLSVSISAAFLLFSYIKGIEGVRFIAGAVYICIEIILCAVFVYCSYKHKRKEFSSHSLLKNIYCTDPLTKVGNRVKLEEEAEKWISFCTRNKLEVSLVVIDVDNLKK